MALAADSCDLCLVGNHDLVVLGKLDVAEFSANAAVAATWTREHIESNSVDYLAALRPQDEEHAIGLYHASPRDPVWEYVLSTAQAGACMDAMSPRVGAIGHSHVALWFMRGDAGAVSGDTAPGGTELDLSEGDWLVNPGGGISHLYKLSSTSSWVAGDHFGPPPNTSIAGKGPSPCGRTNIPCRVPTATGSCTSPSLM